MGIYCRRLGCNNSSSYITPKYDHENEFAADTYGVKTRSTKFTAQFFDDKANQFVVCTAVQYIDSPALLV